jgi:cell division protein ZapE
MSEVSLSPKQRYSADLDRAGFVADTAQANAVELLEDLFHRLVARADKQSHPFAGFCSALRGKVLGSKRRRPEQGLYFWGGVGRGKTYLVDTFFEALPFQAKMRVHFHRFMQRVHDDLTGLVGEKNPLEKIADNISKEALVICFDEFFVSDIADAMLLGGLMEALFHRGVTLVATSNIQPSELYKDGLQRGRFLPAIALIEQYTQVVNVDSGTDYRLRTLEKAELWHYPLDPEASGVLASNFSALANEVAPLAGAIEINHRAIEVVSAVESILWVTFEELCQKPRSASDFVELGRIYQTVLLDGIRVMGADEEDVARRFINLIDEFYDRNVKLVATAEASPEGLYQGARLQFEYQRTLSRLREMQSREYLAQEHRP